MKFFTAEDFAEQEWQPISSAQAANIANQKLQREAKVVYGSANHNKAIFNWEVFGGDDGEHTHRALLICIEEIERNKCEHKPFFSGGKYASYCDECGVKIKPTGWEVVDEQR